MASIPFGRIFERYDGPWHAAPVFPLDISKHENKGIHAWLVDPPILSFIGLEFDAVLHCSGSLSTIEGLYHKHRDIVSRYAAVRRTDFSTAEEGFQKVHTGVQSIV